MNIALFLRQIRINRVKVCSRHKSSIILRSGRGIRGSMKGEKRTSFTKMPPPYYLKVIAASLPPFSRVHAPAKLFSPLVQKQESIVKEFLLFLFKKTTTKITSHVFYLHKLSSSLFPTPAERRQTRDVGMLGRGSGHIVDPPAMKKIPSHFLKKQRLCLLCSGTSAQSLFLPL